MSAVAEIEAAIEKLTELRDASKTGAWRTGWNHQQFFIRGDEAGDYGHVTEWTYTIHPGNSDEMAECDTADADLIVTLHRTIDAQLAILRAGRTAFGAAFKETPPPDLPGWAAEARSHSLSFARAINGTA